MARVYTPRKKTEMVEITYWACAHSNHKHHDTRVKAELCIRKDGFKTLESEPEKLLRAISCTKAVVKGLTFDKSGELFGVSRETARSMAKQCLETCINGRFKTRPPCTKDNLDKVRLHRTFWLGRLKLLEEDCRKRIKEEKNK